ncbi:hypothetical protein EYC98_03680 [Halieaceae bacterium IMCC14734]|uniref:DM13 domain-containing protein n=1 Tax=Candidatus Litorirhabdus singularis TaxID=2518993 RepID=A0ABT3TCF9_9GAMM|nr:DM13 domain-containing protein [Candidatus Litorirhabdus singularis]MCX2979961.1 hypothetical protein [Candidatus Litorirhabdus singularis]
MNVRALLALIVSHSVVAAVGFAMGIYALPILTAPPAPSDAEVQVAAAEATYVTEFVRELRDSDGLHWGEGTVTITANSIALMGKLAPGPDYKLYLSPEFVETEADFLRLKSRMVQVADVRTFDNFVVSIPGSIEVDEFRAIIIWCESFGQFITAAEYR